MSNDDVMLPGVLKIADSSGLPSLPVPGVFITGKALVVLTRASPAAAACCNAAILLVNTPTLFLSSSQSRAVASNG